MVAMAWCCADVRIITQEFAEKLSRVLSILRCKMPQRCKIARLQLPASGLLWHLRLIEVRVAPQVAIVRVRNLPATRGSQDAVRGAAFLASRVRYGLTGTTGKGVLGGGWLGQQGGIFCKLGNRGGDRVCRK
eukprot:COSAG02_NODE_12044_length_1607_cov_149.277257_2_plen_132_part_00